MECNQFITSRVAPENCLGVSLDASLPPTHWLSPYLPPCSLNPKMVVKVHSEAEVRRILPIAKRLGVPITFRAAGTSLSGQASDRWTPPTATKQLQHVYHTIVYITIITYHQPTNLPTSCASLSLSLSLCQAITDSVLLKLSHTGKNFRNYEVHVSIPPERCATCIHHGVRSHGITHTVHTQPSSQKPRVFPKCCSLPNA